MVCFGGDGYEVTRTGACEREKRFCRDGLEGENYVLCDELTVLDAVVPMQSEAREYEYGRHRHAIRVREC